MMLQQRLSQGSHEFGTAKMIGAANKYIDKERMQVCLTCVKTVHQQETTPAAVF